MKTVGKEKESSCRTQLISEVPYLAPTQLDWIQRHSQVVRYYWSVNAKTWCSTRLNKNPFTNYLKDTATHIGSEHRKKKSKLIPKTIDSAKYNILI